MKLPDFSFSRFTGLTLHYLYTMKRNPARLIEIFVWPSFELVLFSMLVVSVSSVVSPEEKLGLNILSGVVFWNFFARIIQESSSQLIDDALSKNVQNILLTPISLFELSMSLFSASVIKMSMSFVILFSIVYFLYPAFFTVIGIYVLLWTAALVLFGCIVSLGLLGFIFLYGERLSFIGWLASTVIQIFSCVFYPRSALPRGLYELSYAVPASYVFESMREFVGRREFRMEPIAMALGIMLVYFAASLAVFRISYSLAKKSGSLAKI